MSSRALIVVAAAAFFAACKPQDPVIAKVGSTTITQSEFQRKLADVSQGYQNYVVTPNGRRQFLDILIREKMILAAAQASDVRKSAEFRTQLDRLRSEEEDRLREGRDYLMTSLWLEQLRDKGVVKASEDEARDWHRKHPVEVEVRHILVATPAEAEALAKKARGGANFALLAKSNSLDAATAADGGKMPPAIYGEIIPDLEDAVFRMRSGEVIGPIKSKFGYHVLRKDAEHTLKFEDAQERIMRLLEKQKLDRYLQSIQDKFPVEVVDEQFK
jgi:parvulin-like peptidyl-prolyl isomerase